MNYIAHIHLGHHTQTSLVGNFLGDFVKGSELNHLPPDIELGIRLHRSVDSFTDSHPLIIRLKGDFPTTIRRMAGVVIDIYFDHLLLTHWHHYTYTSYDSLFSDFYLDLAKFKLANNRKFERQANSLIAHQWLNEYIQPETCFQAFLSIERRLKGKITFATDAQNYLTKNKHLFVSTFVQFYPSLLEHGLHFIQNNQQSIARRNA